MSNLYTRPFAKYYDVIKARRLPPDARQDLEFLKFAFENLARIPVSKVLDVGCGTGRHYIPLTQRGYKVTGLDLSQNMLDMLSEKALSAKLPAPQILRKDMREIDFSNEFDALICMNTAFLYLLTDEDILQTLKAFYKALKPGGVAVIDIINFLSLLGRYEENMVENFSQDGTNFKLAIKHWVEDVPGIFNHDEFGIIEGDSKVITYHELHRYRMLNYNEMQKFLKSADFCEIRCFGEFTAREEVRSNAKRLIFVALR